MTIRILPEEVASQIAAGEVVERPSSVVKELLENALDAGARSVEIRVDDAGRKLVQVADDGVGIPPGELHLAVARHATSKLAFSADLFHIVSLGFRGEALASIASVSRFKLISRHANEETGAEIFVEGGHAGKVAPVGAAQGTVVRVEDLFYNVPARLKFLKTDSTERRRIDELVTRYAIAYPNVRFHLIHNDRNALQTSGNGNAREVLSVLYGADIARRMLAVDSQYENFKLTGFISPMDLTRSNRKEITFFVNGRWVQDSALVPSLTQAYHTYLMVGRYPMAVLFMEIPAEFVDVNVHPSKTEVRFRDPGRIFSDVQRSVRKALLAYTPVPKVHLSPEFGGFPTGPGRASHSEINPAWEMAGEAASDQQGLPRTLPTQADVPQQPALPADRVPLLRLIGQIAAAYLVAEGPDGLYLIDQHAAHERVLFEKLMAMRSGSMPSQALLAPEVIELPPYMVVLLEEQLPILAAFGYQVEAFGNNSFLVRAIPELLTKLAPGDALRVLVEDFEEDETPLQNEVEAKIIARVCKRAAVKSGQVLSHVEQQALVRDLEACTSPRTCPHGRPTMIHLSVDLLERQFGRRGAR